MCRSQRLSQRNERDRQGTRCVLLYCMCTCVDHKDSLDTVREIDREDVNNLLKKGVYNACTCCALLYFVCTYVDHKDSLGAMRGIDREDVNNLLKKGAYNACPRCTSLLYVYMCGSQRLSRRNERDRQGRCHPERYFPSLYEIHCFMSFPSGHHMRNQNTNISMRWDGQQMTMNFINSIGYKQQ